MKKHFLTTAISAMLLAGSSMSAQTAGTLTFSFTPTSHTGYSGTKNVLAVWIQTSTGTFVKTKIRNVGSQTKDHLPTWSVNAGGTAGNALSTSANVTDAVSGATLTTFTAKSITWDGRNVSGSSNGSIVSDGTYRVGIESTWNHGTSATVVRYFNFTKGPNQDLQTPTADANFTNISLNWQPGTSAVEENVKPSAVIYPNPNNGIFNMDYSDALSIRVVNLIGETVLFEKTGGLSSGTKRMNLSHLSSGVYHIVLENENTSTVQRVVINN